MNRVQLAALVLSSAPDRSGKADAGPADPLAPIAGVSVAGWVVDACVGASIRRIAVVGSSPVAATRAELASRADKALVRVVPTGNHDAVEMLTLAIDGLGTDLTINDHAHILIVPAESPQIEASELRSLVERHVRSGASATIISTGAPGSAEASVVSRDGDGVVSIIDPLEPDWDGELGLVCIRASLLLPALRRSTPPEWSGQPLLADALATLDRAGHHVDWVGRSRPLERISSPATRVSIERRLRQRIVARWIERGVAISDPVRVSIDATVELGRGVVLHPGTVLEGNTVIGDVASIGPNTHIVDSTIGTDVRAPSVAIYDTDIAPHSRLAPFSVHGELPG